MKSGDEAFTSVFGDRNFSKLPMLALSNRSLVNMLRDDASILVAGKDVFDLFSVGVPERLPQPTPPAASSEVVRDEGQSHRRKPYSVDQVLHFVRMYHVTSQGNDLDDILVSAAYCLGLEHAPRIEADIIAHRLDVPVRQSLETWAVKNDLMTMLFAREQLGQQRMACHGMADKSPQFGYNLLASREDRQVYGKHSQGSTVGACHFATETYDNPIACMGLGKSGITDTDVKLLQVKLLDCGDKLDYARISLKSWITDQSVEKHFADTPFSLVPAGWPRDPQAKNVFEQELAMFGGFGADFLWPFCFGTHDSMHIAFNSLEARITGSDLWATSQEHIRALLG